MVGKTGEIRVIAVACGHLYRETFCYVTGTHKSRPRQKFASEVSDHKLGKSLPSVYEIFDSIAHSKLEHL